MPPRSEWSRNRTNGCPKNARKHGRRHARDFDVPRGDDALDVRGRDAKCPLSEPWQYRGGQRRYSEANVPSWPARSTTRQVPPDQLTTGLHSSRLRQLQQCTKTWGTLASRCTHPDKHSPTPLHLLLPPATTNQ